MFAQPPEETRAAPASVPWGGVGLFVGLAFAISWIIWLGLDALGVPLVIYAAAGMFGPAAAAALVRGPLRHEGFADAGLRLGHAPRVYLAAYLVVPLLVAAGIGLSLLVSYQHASDPVASLQHMLEEQLSKLPRALPANLTTHELARISFYGQLAAALTVALPFNMIFTFGEELGWRGYLLPRLAPLGGGRAAILTGIVWGLWHAPIIVTRQYNYPGHPWLGVVAMMLLTTALGVVFAWLRFRSGSIWPPALAHAALNAQAGMGLLVLTRAESSLVGAPTGLLAILPIAALAAYLLATGRVEPEPTS